MRWLHLFVIVLFAAVWVLFAAQNLQLVAISFLRFQRNRADGASGWYHLPPWHGNRRQPPRAAPQVS